MKNMKSEQAVLPNPCLEEEEDLKEANGWHHTVQTRVSLSKWHTWIYSTPEMAPSTCNPFPRRTGRSMCHYQQLSFTPWRFMTKHRVDIPFPNIC
jgi:hypothetical protein